MTKRLAAASLIVLVSASPLVGAKVKFISTWKSPDAGRLTYAGRKIVSLVMSDDDALRMSAEEALARELTTRGVDGESAYRLIPREESRDPERARGWFERSGAAAVVAMRLVDIARETPPPGVMWGAFMKDLVKACADEMKKQGLTRRN